VLSGPSPDTFKKVEEMFMSCFPKSNPLPTFPFHLGKEIEAEEKHKVNMQLITQLGVGTKTFYYVSPIEKNTI